MKYFFAFLLCVSIFTAQGQSEGIVEEKSYIEVTGTAEREVMPDIIYISITLRDKVVDKKSYTISEQENKLKNGLQNAGIDLKNLALTGASTDIIKYKRKDKGVEEVKEYELKVATAKDVNRVFELLHTIDVKEASVTRTDHSQLDVLRKEVRISAIKAAKEKATYLLQAIGEEPGKPLVVREEQPYNYRSNSLSNLNVRAVEETGSDETQFESFKIKFSYYVKYSIK
jgi:uncharacterized protein YggE